MIHDRAIQRHLHQAKRRIKRAFWSQRNVTGIGIGLRMRGGEWTDEPAITVTVAKKRKPGYLRASQILPPYVEIAGSSYRVDVIETGRNRFDAAPFRVRQPPDGCQDSEFGGGENEWILEDRVRPLRPGLQIANRATIDDQGNGPAGTLGGFVRGNLDDQIYILSNHHVLMDRLVDPTIGQDIVSPFGDAAANVVATGHAFIPRVPGEGHVNTSDAALARLVDQDASSFTNEYPDDRMPPVGPAHQAIGLYFASSRTHIFGYICRIMPILDRFDVDFLEPNSAVDVTLDHTFRTIEKVGARTGYSSSRIYAVNYDVKITAATGEEIYFEDVIFTDSIGWPGDSGSLVCLGGDGCTWTSTYLPYRNEAECIVFWTLALMYGLPLENDYELGDRIRDEFLAQSRLGRALTEIFYLNSENMVTRAENSTATDYEKAGARSLYDKYRNFTESALNNPGSPSLVVTQEHLDDIQFAINGASLQMSAAESDALMAIYNDVIAPALGMRYTELLDYMNDPLVYNKVQDVLIPVPTIITQGVVGPN